MRYYCLFHNSGFRTYRINGEPSEELTTQMVTTENRHDYPAKGDVFMNMSAFRVVFYYMDEDTITLVVNGIPSIRKDTGGKPINCAFQIIAGKNEEMALRKIAYKISSDLGNFHTFYADLFTLRGGLQIAGDRLMDYLKDAIDSNDSDELPMPKSMVVEEQNESDGGGKEDPSIRRKVLNVVKKKVLEDLKQYIILIVIFVAILVMIENCQSKKSSKQSVPDSTHLTTCDSCRTAFERDSVMVVSQ